MTYPAIQQQTFLIPHGCNLSCLTFARGAISAETLDPARPFPHRQGNKSHYVTE
jgi:hypothetical protein